MKYKFKFLLIFGFCLISSIIFSSNNTKALTLTGDMANGYTITYESKDFGQEIHFSSTNTNGSTFTQSYGYSDLSMPTSFPNSISTTSNADLVIRVGGDGLPNYYLQILFSGSTTIPNMGYIAKTSTTSKTVYFKLNPTTSSKLTYVAPVAITPQKDVLNYNWTGNGLRIYNLQKGMNVSGYQDTSGLKYFDIETYGKFVYTGSDTFFTTIAYKNMQTYIQLASILTYGTDTRRCGEGLGIKSFEWISDTSHLNNGDLIKYRIVYQAPMLDKGTYNISLGTTINDGASNQWIKDTIESVNFLNENAETGVFNNTGETGNVGVQPGNLPQGADTSANGTLTSIITMFSSFSGFIGSIFGFLPTEIKVMFTGVCILIVGLMVKRAVI